LLQDGRPVELMQTGQWEYQWRATLRMTGANTHIELVRVPR
jgi:hypothetical protein